MNTCRLTTRKQAKAEGYRPYTTQINRTTLQGKRILEGILRDARVNDCDHVCVRESNGAVTVWRKGYIDTANDDETAARDAELALRDLINEFDIGHRGISYVR